MQCPYCRTKIGYFQKPSPCSKCQNELKTKIDIKTLFIMVVTIGVTYSLVKTLFGIEGIYQHILFGITLGIIMLPATMIVPKNVKPEDTVTLPKINIGKHIGIGAVVIIVAGLLISITIDTTYTNVNVIAPADMEEETIKELLGDPEVQKLLEE